ncbi:hypothetical protein CPC08DRAFT_709486 [Agrocybe pediades]|nr:hypothetical protein CPC08DRAFT_709486 [Agrocybe pediades]
MSGLLAPLRSALKQPSRPSSPVNGIVSPPAPVASPVNSTVPDSPNPSVSVQCESPTSAKTSQFHDHETPLHSAMSSVHHHCESDDIDNQHHSLTPSTSNSHVPSSAPYTPKVSFDTFENPVASMFSFTLSVKSAGYRRTRNTRVLLCASSPDESGSEALDWCLEALVQDGDELIVFRGVDEDVLDKPHDILRNEARALMASIQEKSTLVDPTRKLSLILEYIPGKITDTIDRLIALYRPDSLVVGTRGKRFGLVQNLGAGLVQQLGGSQSIGSVSKYCLSHSPVPVIVVRPGRKLRKAVEKRRADPKRGKHFES